jgi:hypothetical protein
VRDGTLYVRLQGNGGGRRSGDHAVEANANAIAFHVGLIVKGRAKLQTYSEAKEKKEWRGRSEEGRLTTNRRISSTSMRKIGKLNLPSVH